MKLTGLNPSWVGSGGPGVTLNGKPVLRREGVGLMCDCPCGCGTADEGRALYVAFANPLDGGPPEISPGEPTWQRVGDTFETLTLTPSILRSVEKGGCGWHGHIRQGEVVVA